MVRAAFDDAVDRSVMLELKLVSLRQERDQLVKRVGLLKSGSLEKDMLDEQARYHLNMLRTDEIAIMK